MATNAINLPAITVMALLTGFGILFVVLGCALADNFWPLMSLFIFIFAGVPLLLCGEPMSGDFASTTTDSILTEQAHFLTGFFAVSGIALNLVLRHGEVIETSTLLWTMMGFVTLSAAVGFLLWTLRKPTDLMLS